MGAFSDFLPIPVQILLVGFLRLEEIVNGPAVGSGHGSHIQRRLHPAFHLQAVNARLHQLRNMLHHAQILGIEQKSASLVLLHGQILPRSGLLHHRVFPAAGMGTGPLIGIPSREIIAQKAAAGIGDTHGPMHEAFYLHVLRYLPPYLLQLLKRKLSGRHHPLGSLPMPE